MQVVQYLIYFWLDRSLQILTNQKLKCMIFARCFPIIKWLLKLNWLLINLFLLLCITYNLLLARWAGRAQAAQYICEAWRSTWSTDSMSCSQEAFGEAFWIYRDIVQHQVYRRLMGYRRTWAVLTLVSQLTLRLVHIWQLLSTCIFDCSLQCPSSPLWCKSSALTKRLAPLSTMRYGLWWETGMITHLSSSSSDTTWQ